jgi:hypothetical protein
VERISIIRPRLVQPRLEYIKVLSKGGRLPSSDQDDFSREVRNIFLEVVFWHVE